MGNECLAGFLLRQWLKDSMPQSDSCEPTAFQKRRIRRHVAFSAFRSSRTTGVVPCLAARSRGEARKSRPPLRAAEPSRQPPVMPSVDRGQRSRRWTTAR